ncbi:MAG: hypothetical protein PHX25_00930 [Candidatus Pacebacteria bacterium]|nr:hypothetical protein [Candidatus Paceibacterota bacterium]
MKDKNLKNKILEAIKEKDISPKPKWQFLLKDYFLWFLGAISVFVGGVAVSLIIFTLINSDWEYYRYLSNSLFEHIVKMAPYLWIVVLGGFVLTADYNFSNTKDGYKYSVPKITGLSILFSIILGGLFYQFGLAYFTDYMLGINMPMYHGFIEKRQDLWNRPEEGLLAGTIVPLEKSDAILVKDFDGKEWNVEVGRLNRIDFIILDEAETVALIGYVKNENTFDACMVKPWRVGGENSYLRNKIMERAIREGVEPPAMGMGQGRFENMRGMMRENNADERNIFKMRNIECERGTTSPAGPKITN